MPKEFNRPVKAFKACVGYMSELLEHPPPEIPSHVERHMFDIMEQAHCERRVRESLRRLGWA